MYFPEHFLEKIRDLFPLSESIGKRVKLERRGKEFVGLCPFHQEKTPSFTVNDDKKFYHCFGCAAHGDIIKFTCVTQGMDFNEAVIYLAEKVGLTIPNNYRDHATTNDQQELYRALQLASDYFREQLQLPKYQPVLDYLHARQINNEFIAKFAIGYAPPERHGIKSYLTAKGISEDIITRAGLLVRNDNGEVYSKFRERIMFPIMDSKSRIIAFGGRGMNDIQPKYLNSPETELFKKGEILYGANWAKPAAQQNKRVIIVEGYIDLIAMHRAGIEEVVASLGTAITKEQVAYLWRLAKEPVICLDGDNAGIRAMLRAAELVIPLLKPGYSFKFATLPANTDPDELIKLGGKDAIEQVLHNALPLAETIWNSYWSTLPPGYTPEQKAELEHNLQELTNKITDKTVRFNYRSYFNSKLWESTKKRKQNVAAPANEAARIKKTMTYPTDPIQVIEYTLINILLDYPELLTHTDIFAEFSALHLSDIYATKIRDFIIDQKTNNNFNYSELKSSLEKSDFLPNILLYRLKEGNGSIISKFSDPVSSWHYSVSKLNLVLLEKEYQDEVHKMTDESMNKAYILKEQIINIRKHISNLEREYLEC